MIHRGPRLRPDDNSSLRPTLFWAQSYSFDRETHIATFLIPVSYGARAVPAVIELSPTVRGVGFPQMSQVQHADRLSVDLLNVQDLLVTGSSASEIPQSVPAITTDSKAAIAHVRGTPIAFSMFN